MKNPRTCRESVDMLCGSTATTRKPMAGGLSYKGKLLVDWEAENEQLKAENGVLHRRIDEMATAEVTRDAAQVELDAWKSAFGTSQLDHAIAERDALKDEVQRLKAERDAALEREAGMRNLNAGAEKESEYFLGLYNEQLAVGIRQTEELHAALEVLRQVEWGCETIYGDDLRQYCPWCHEIRGVGHKSDCRLAALLKGKEAKP